MLKQRNYNEMVTYILDKIRNMDISEDDKKALFAYITSLETKYFMEMGNAQRWTPCSERLPDREGEYLVTWGTINVMCVLHYDQWGDWTDEYDNIIDGSNVIAWMPLPEPYKEGSDD